jgi:hypothetical protein
MASRASTGTRPESVPAKGATAGRGSAPGATAGRGSAPGATAAEARGATAGRGSAPGATAGRGSAPGAPKATSGRPSQPSPRGSPRPPSESGDPKRYPRSVRELLSRTQTLSSEGAGQEEIVAFVYEVAEHYGIRIRHDQHDPHTGPAPKSPAATPKSPEGAVRLTSSTDSPGETLGPKSPSAEQSSEPKDAAEAKDATEPRARKGRGKNMPVLISRRPDGAHVMTLTTTPPSAGADPDVLEDQAAPIKGATVGRLVLSGDKRGGGSVRGRGVPLYYECNGLVIDARTWRALAVPPCAFNLRPNAKAVDAALADNLYDVIHADDGTVVTLYSWNHPTDGDVWALASSNGYDVSSLYWIGNRTYAEVVFDLIERHYPALKATAGASLEKRADGITRLVFAGLRRDLCYTLGFRHHNFHPLFADPERVWQIQHTELAEVTPHVVQRGGLPGIPDQTTRTEELKTALGSSPITLAGLRELGADSYEAALKIIGGGDSASFTLNYGYILRSRYPERTRENSDILVESPLLARIRRLAYERAPRAIRDKLTADERLEHNALRAYLTASERLVFLALFPHWEPKFRAYEEFVNNVVHFIVHTMRQHSMTPASREPALRSVTGQVARALLDFINRHETLTPFHQDTEGIVRDYVMNPEYAYLYLRAVRSSALLTDGAKSVGTGA